MGKVSKVGRWRYTNWPHEPETLEPRGGDPDDWFHMADLLAELCGHPEGQLVRVTIETLEPDDGK